MKNYRLLFPLLFSVIFISGCTSTFFGTVLVITFRDILLYVGIAFIVAFAITFVTDNQRKTLLLWTFINLLLTPLVGLIYLLIKITGRK
ncbi:MAG: hypothetical protein ABI723_18615 [Bacteroidia bacterium]